MLKRYGKEIGIFAILLVLCVFLAVMRPQFISPINLQNTTRLIGIFGIFSLGLAVVIITGGIDLSVGSLIALLGVLLSMFLVKYHWAPPLALIAVLGIGAILGFGQSVLVTRAKLQPFIVTLCGLLIYRGAARYIANDETQGFGTAEGFEWLKEAAIGNVLGVPIPFILLIITAIVMWVVLHRSVYGRYLFAIGRNEEAARFSGVNTRAVEAGAYVIVALLASVSAVLFAFYTNSVSPSNHGNFYELYGIAAAVLGGCSLRGGEGSVVGVLFGVALLQVLQNFVNLMRIPSSLNFAVMGGVILVGVLADSLLKERRAT